jgi:integrase
MRPSRRHYRTRPAQIRKQGGRQTKRILGIIPNFRAVSVDTHLPPQTPKEKFVGFAQDSFDYSSFIWIGALAGVSHALLLTVVQTGLRLSEITSIRQQDVSLGKGAHIRCEGKGRKERCTPLAKSTVMVLAAWIGEQGESDGTRILFPTLRGSRLSADAVQHLVGKYVAMAQKTCLSLADKRVSPHVLRHTTAMELLQSGVDRTLIALWLGHESVETTQIYLDANLAIKEEILSKTAPINPKAGRYRPDDNLLAFLKGL